MTEFNFMVTPKHPLPRLTATMYAARHVLYTNTLSSQREGVEEEVITELAVWQGRSRVSVRAAVCRWSYDHLTATYLILASRRARGASIRLPSPANTPQVSWSCHEMATLALVTLAMPHFDNPLQVNILQMSIYVNSWGLCHQHF